MILKEDKQQVRLKALAKSVERKLGPVKWDGVAMVLSSTSVSAPDKTIDGATYFVATNSKGVAGAGGVVMCRLVMLFAALGYKHPIKAAERSGLQTTDQIDAFFSEEAKALADKLRIAEPDDFERLIATEDR
jgi:hypothetical protein